MPPAYPPGPSIVLVTAKVPNCCTTGLVMVTAAVPFWVIVAGWPLNEAGPHA